MANGHGGPRSSNVINAGQVPKGQPYGTGVQQQQALAAVPLSGPSTTQRRPSPSAQQALPVGGVEPGQIPSLSDPSTRPDEPVTTGLPLGPGAGPDALGGIFPQAPQELLALRELYAAKPDPQLRRLIQWTESQL